MPSKEKANFDLLEVVKIEMGDELIVQTRSQKELNLALSLAQGDLKNVVGNKSNDFFNSRYADLATVLDVIRATCADHHLSYPQQVSFNGSSISVITELRHISGEFRVFKTKLSPREFDLQAVAGAWTYARRHALCAIFGLAVADNDGNHTPPPPEKPKKTRLMGGRNAHK